MISETRAAVANFLSSSSLLTAECADVSESASFESDEIVAADELCVRVDVVLGRHYGLIEARGQDIDQIDVARELVVLLLRDRARDEDPEVSDRTRGRRRRWSGLARLMSSTLSYRSRIQPNACWGGVMLSAFEQKTTIGERMLRRSILEPSADG